MTNETVVTSAKEQVNQALADILSKVVSGVDGVVEFSKEQIPDVVNQLLMWHALESLLGFFVGVVFFSFGFYRWKIQLKLRSKYETLCQEGKMGWDMKDFHIFFSYATPPVLVIIGFCVLAINLEFIKILVAPKLYLLEYAAKLVGQ